MDIKTLLDNLHDEVSCSVCMCTFTDPKQLPCLHSFCLHCLHGIQRRSGVHGKITCPECRRQFQINGSGNPSQLPTNFRINSLLDVLAIKKCSTVNVKCGNCDKQSAQTLYCFQCRSFWCEECILGHNMIRTNKEHKTLALKDFQDQDFEAVLQRPAICQKKHHEKEELKFFCKSCKVAICNTCAVTLHEGHGKMPLQEATDGRKAQINSMITSLKDKIVEKRKEVEQFNQKSIEVQAQVAAVKSQVQTNADQMIAIIEARKQDVFDAVDNQAKKSLETLSQKKGKVENQVKIIESAIEQTESLMKRNFSTEILGFNETFDTILQEQVTQEDRDTKCIPRFGFTESEAVIKALNSEGIGNVKTVFSDTTSNQSAGIAGNTEAEVPDSPFEAHLQTRRYIPVLSFGQEDLNEGIALADDSFLMKVLRSKLVQNKNEVEVQRNDPSSPLHSVKSFEELPLSERLRRGVYDMGFNKPSKIQETALPMLLADPPNNMIVQSQPGTGKTAALVLSMLCRVDSAKNFPQVICISPTYELALQTGQVAEKMAKFCPEVKIGYAVRGQEVSRGQKVTDHIIFATPGTILDWILRHRALDPKKVKMFVLDEADVMIALQGHQDQSVRICRTMPKDCQMLLFFATYDNEVMKFAKTVVPDLIIIRQRESLENIKQYYVVCRDEEDKFQALSNMYHVVSIGQCIVFCHTRTSASWLAEKMTADGHSVALLSGEITVEQRLAVLNRFREGKEKVLITTNVSLTGIDSEQVTVAVNYDMPAEPTGKPDFETYLHRICRTGRFGRKGIAVNFIDGQRSMTVMKKIEEHFGEKISLLQTDDIDELDKLGN